MLTLKRPYCMIIKSQIFGVWRSLVAHVVWDHGAGSSSLFTPTRKYLGPLAQLVRAVGS